VFDHKELFICYCANVGNLSLGFLSETLNPFITEPQLSYTLFLIITLFFNENDKSHDSFLYIFHFLHIVLFIYTHCSFFYLQVKIIPHHLNCFQKMNLDLNIRL